MFQTISPVDGRVYVERETASAEQIDAILALARAAQSEWKELPVARRAELCSRMVDAFVAQKDRIAEEITWQMGRPIRYTPLEVLRFEERARYMIRCCRPGARGCKGRAAGRLHAVHPPRSGGRGAGVGSLELPLFDGGELHRARSDGRKCRRAQAFAPELRCARNASPMRARPLVSRKAFSSFCTPRTTTWPTLSATSAWTLSRSQDRCPAAIPCSGRPVGASSRPGWNWAGRTRLTCGPMSISPHAIENLVDGANFNSGQSCCGVERIYVDSAILYRFRRRLRRSD